MKETEIRMRGDDRKRTTTRRDGAGLCAGLQILPRFAGRAWRSDYGTVVSKICAYDVIKFERDELGNNSIFEHLPESILCALKSVPCDEIVWVAKTRATARRYGRAQPWDIGDDAAVLADDLEGGYLVLMNATKHLKLSPTQ
jgi:hypothetical protein